MQLDTAREFKAELTAYRDALLAEQAIGRDERGTLAVGVCPLGVGTYAVAVRCSYESGPALALAARGRELAGEECDVRYIGQVRPHQWDPGDLQQRVRPLHPGLSIAHLNVTAGTVGALVFGDDGRARLLSNNHVLADSDRGALGDVVLQPGPADGGDPAADRIGALEAAAPLDPDAPHLIDAAIAVLDDGVEFTAEYPSGALNGITDATDDVLVEKVGRTTGITQGTVSAVEVDGIDVGYPAGLIEFDDQVEISGAGVAFSSGGDSGSLVYRPDTMEAIGLLFAGSETGGPAGTGLTYCNPIGAVVEAFGLRLA